MPIAIARIKREVFSQRLPLKDLQFLNILGLDGNIAQQTVNCCRKQLGNSFRIDPEKLYPDDLFRDIIKLPAWDWDMLELILELENALNIEIDEELVPNWTSKNITLGQWILEFVYRISH
jgi:hypothetical protein